MNDWVGPSSNSTSNGKSSPSRKYRALVVDSGPIIKRNGGSEWIGKADAYYTIPAVLEEIRDAKARQHLSDSLIDWKVREPSAAAMKRVIDFSKQTGDYPALSNVDLQVLALCVDLELEGCHTLDHLRTTPKRTIGLGKIQTLNKNAEGNGEENGAVEEASDAEDDEDDSGSASDGEIEDDQVEDNTDVVKAENDNAGTPAHQSAESKPAPYKTWGPVPKPSGDLWIPKEGQGNLAEGTLTVTKMSCKNDQFDDAEEDVDPLKADLKSDFPSLSAAAAVPYEGDQDTLQDELKSDFPSLAAAAAVPYEGDDTQAELKSDFPSLAAASSVPYEGDEDPLQAELQSDFPSLAVAASVPYEGSDDEEDNANDGATEDLPSLAAPPTLTEEERQRKKEEALKPISKSGKLYNSFRKYGSLMKPKSKTTNAKKEDPLPPLMNIASDDKPHQSTMGSKIIGSMGAEDMKAEDDDGEGWITSTKQISAMKANGGQLDPARGSIGGGDKDSSPAGPPISDRAACTTTDFAMQNVLLQMGLHLLSVDGMQIRRLKTWVMRCGACYKVHTDPMDPRTGLPRMFCSHCGSDMMQRVSASVDGKTGRLKLHFSRKYKNNIRGTKFSLPKAGSGNRFQGDLLLREDQLLTGAWNQKVKVRGGGKSREHAQSIFGKDIASNVGCNAKAVHMDQDIKVGFGRRNPNSAKGRERRGKKKKSSDRACGLRRY